jgi:hypothetical protein
VLLKSHVKTYTRKDGTIVKEHNDSRSKKAQPAPTGHHHALVALLRKRKVATGDGKKPKGRIGHPMALLRTVAKKKVEPGKDAAKEEKKAASKPRKPKETAAATRKRIEAEIRGGEPRTVLGETHYVKVLAKARREEDEIVDYFNSDLIKSEEKRDAHGRFSRTEESARHDAKLRRLYGQAAGKENHPIEGHVIRSVTREEAEKIRRLTGISVDNYRFGVTNTGLRHVHKEHGNETVEAQANQVAIKEHDIQRIPDIISRPKVIRRAHDTPQGNKTISFEKEYTDGTEVYIVEVIARSSLLHVKTMFKKKP